MGLFDWCKSKKEPKTAPNLARKRNLLKDHPNLWWLTDVPMFLDETSVDRLFGAIVQPEFILQQQVDTAQKGHTEAAGEEAEAGGEVSIPTFFKLSTKAKLTSTSTDSALRSAQITKQFVYTSEQRLQDIVVAYTERYPARVLFSQPGMASLKSLSSPSLSWADAERLLNTAGVRPLLFLDLESGAEILPMAGESKDGKIRLIFETMIDRLEQARGNAIPQFPKDKEEDAETLRRRYWDALIREYDNRIALESIEHSFNDGQRIDWIDYRLKLATRDVPVHLHFSPAGKYPTGVFAYNLVRRGHTVGLRIVGQLKKDCDINVLALYER